MHLITKVDRYNEIDLKRNLAREIARVKGLQAEFSQQENDHKEAFSKMNTKLKEIQSNSVADPGENPISKPTRSTKAKYPQNLDDFEHNTDDIDRLSKLNEDLKRKNEDLKQKLKATHEKLVKKVGEKAYIIDRIQSIGIDLSLLETPGYKVPTNSFPGSRQEYRTEERRKTREDPVYIRENQEHPTQHHHVHYDAAEDHPNLRRHSPAIRAPCPVHSVSPPPHLNIPPTYTNTPLESTGFNNTKYTSTGGIRYHPLMEASRHNLPQYHQTTGEQPYRSQDIHKYIRTEDQSERPPRPDRLDIQPGFMKEYPRLVHPSPHDDPQGFMPPRADPGNRALVSATTYRDNLADLTEDDLQERIKHLLHTKESFYANK